MASILVLATTLACQAEVETPAAVTVADSAGVRIISIHQAAVEVLPRWRVAAEPSLTIGELEGDAEYLFGDIVDGALLRSGHIVVADGQANEARVFGPDGGWSSTIGGTGRGPLEFSQLGHVWPLEGAGFAMVDVRLAKVVTVDVSTGEAFSTPTGPDMCQDVAVPWACSVVGVLERGQFVTRAVTPRGASLPLSPRELRLVDGADRRLAVSTAGTVAPLTSFTAGSMSVLGYNDGTIWYFDTPFEPRPSVAVGGAKVVVGDPRGSAIRTWSQEGTLRQEVRLQLDPPISRAEHIDRMHAWADAGATTRPIRDYLGMAELPDTVPAFGDLRVDSEGRVWVSPYSPSTELAPLPKLPWLLLSPEGEPIAWVDGVPADDVLDISGEAILAKGLSPEGAPVVMLLPLKR